MSGGRLYFARALLLEQLHERIPDYSIKPGEEPKYTMGIRAVDYLPLVFTPPS